MIPVLAFLSLAIFAHDHSAMPMESVPVEPALSGQSVYQLPISLVDQNNHAFQLRNRLGHPVIITMFYTSCQFVCPTMIDTLRKTNARLSASEQAQLSLILVTFDPARDTVAVLKETASQRSLEGAQWTLARTDTQSVRKLAAILGIQYRQLPDGDFNHSTDLILLDGEGKILARSNKMGQVDEEFLQRVRAALH
jgi:protein SCO1/2